MAKGRRAQIRRHLERSLGALDRYIHHLQACSEIVSEDNLELDKSLEALSYFALILQNKTNEFRKRI